jgi:hypothetical protein
MEKELLVHGELQVVSASVYLEKYKDQLPYFTYKHAFYTVPTIELIDYLKKEIEGRAAIEIGSGCGVIGKALGIPCTDSKLQNQKFAQLYYTANAQPTITYGKHVEHLEALEAVKKYKPHTVIGSWITSKYNYEKKLGNQWGPNEIKMLKYCKRYIHIGNTFVHDWKDINDLPHKTIKLEGYISRASKPEGNVIQIWESGNED